MKGHEGVGVRGGCVLAVSALQHPEHSTPNVVLADFFRPT